MFFSFLFLLMSPTLWLGFRIAKGRSPGTGLEVLSSQTIQVEPHANTWKEKRDCNPALFSPCLWLSGVVTCFELL